MELPRPQVTVVDPRRPGVLVAVEEPEPARLGRRGAAVLAVAAVVGAAALFTADVARDRREALEQRRLDRVVDVALGATTAPWSSSHDFSTGTGSVQGAVSLVNRGPRDVRVVSAQLGRLRAEEGPTLGPDGGEGVVVLHRSVDCPRDGGPPPQEPEAGPLRVRLDTPSGPKDLVFEGAGLPTGSLRDSVQQACLYPPLRESVRFSATVTRLEERSAVVRVDLANVGRRPVRLLSVVPARGLVVLDVDGDATSLPEVLPAPTGRLPTERTLELRLGVVCSAVLGADLLRPFEELAAIVEDEDRSQITSVGAVARDPGRQLRQLARRTCSSG